MFAIYIYSYIEAFLNYMLGMQVTGAPTGEKLGAMCRLIKFNTYQHNAMVYVTIAFIACQ